MKKLIAIAVAIAAVGFIGSAGAADMPVKAVRAPLDPGYNWTGWYVGVNAGGAWGKAKATETVGLWNGLGNSWSSNTSGFVGGGQIGYNWQQVGSPFVLGLEADLGYLGFKGSAVSPLALTQASGTQVATTGGLYGTARGRLGYAVNNWLLYATGGAIFADVKGQVSDPLFAVPLAAASSTGWQTGWTAGGGVEWGFGLWSVKAEYLYFDLGAKTVIARGAILNFPAWAVKSTGSIARIGLNYHFASH